MIYLGKPIDAEEARRLGLVDWCVGTNRVAGRLDGLLTTLADRGVGVLAATPRALRRSIQAAHREAALQAAEDVHLSGLAATRDTVEGVRAFLEKREPSRGNR